MRQLLTDGLPLDGADLLPNNLAHLLRDGLSLVGDCLVLGKSDAVPRRDSVRAAVTDNTGYECFVNHIHLKECGSSAAVIRDATAFCRRVSAEAVRVIPNQSVRFIISKNGEDWTVHFHTLRPNESYVSDDLEKYLSEAVLVVDSSEL